MEIKLQQVFLSVSVYPSIWRRRV